MPKRKPKRLPFAERVEKRVGEELARRGLQA